MGNCASASGIIAPRIRIVQASERRVVDVQLPSLQCSMKVGELMLEFPPGHFITQLNLRPEPSANLMTGLRATPLAADADAKPGIVYVLYPMSRLHTRIIPLEVLSFSKLVHLQDQQLCATLSGHHIPGAGVQVLGLFTGGARVAPLHDEGCKDAGLSGWPGTDTTEQAFEQQLCNIVEESSSCGQGRMGVINKPKPWVPALQTIMESS